MIWFSEIPISWKSKGAVQKGPCRAHPVLMFCRDDDDEVDQPGIWDSWEVSGLQWWFSISIDYGVFMMIIWRLYMILGYRWFSILVTSSWVSMIHYGTWIPFSRCKRYFQPLSCMVWCSYWYLCTRMYDQNLYTVAMAMIYTLRCHQTWRAGKWTIKLHHFPNIKHKDQWFF